ncbi:MAG: 4Fe-4S dicluster domain-containing protein [Candidatus Methanomethylicia archaeon]|nr:4Fe-4S dicluster domain-containing protein [Candidatus Methanomethylicia archaeon]
MFKGLAQMVYELSGKNPHLCYQCGICSGGCPMIKFMDIPPHQIIRMIQFDIHEVLNCKSIWICSSCNTCTVRCPRDVDPARMINVLRTIVQRRNIYPLNLRSVKGLGELPQIALISASRKFTG